MCVCVCSEFTVHPRTSCCSHFLPFYVTTGDTDVLCTHTPDRFSMATWRPKTMRTSLTRSTARDKELVVQNPNHWMGLDSDVTLPRRSRNEARTDDEDVGAHAESHREGSVNKRSESTRDVSDMKRHAEYENDVGVRRNYDDTNFIDTKKRPREERSFSPPYDVETRPDPCPRPVDVNEDEEISTEETKRQKRECFRCGGRNHIAMVCTSAERDACNNPSLPKCSLCNGRGHAAGRCPTVVNANPCYRCRQPGHFARNCPYDLYGNDENSNMRAPFYNYNAHTYNDGPVDIHSSMTVGSTHRTGRTSPTYGATYGRRSDEEMHSRQIDGSDAAATRKCSLERSERVQREAIHNGSSSGRETFGSRARTHSSNVDVEAVHTNERSGSSWGGRSNMYNSFGTDGNTTHSPYTTTNMRAHSGRCFRCDQFGHWTKDCPRGPRDADPSACYKCGKLGHKSRECNACYLCFQVGHRKAACPNAR